jgi:hypothetical protein
MLVICSLLPFFVHTALRKTLLDTGFNSWIQKPGFAWKGIAALVPLAAVVYWYLRFAVFPKYMNVLRRRLADYLVFTSAVFFLFVFGVSLFYRSILLEKYLIILFPFMAAGFALVSAVILENARQKAVAGMCVIGMFICISAGYETELGGTSGVYQECEAFISRDSQSHPEAKSIEFPAGSLANWVLPNWTLPDWLTRAWTLPEQSFYGNGPLPLFERDSQFDVLYFKQLYLEPTIYREMEKAGISAAMAVKIRVNRSNSVFKVYGNKKSPSQGAWY